MSETKVRPVLSAILWVMRKAGYVQKMGKNQSMDYKFVQEAGVIELLRPHMIEAGLVIVPNVKMQQIDQDRNVYVETEYTVTHVDSGDFIVFTMPGCGNDYRGKSGMAGDKGLPKAITGANKYALLKLFQLPTGDDPEIDSDIDKDDVKKPALKAVPKQEPKPEPADPQMSDEDKAFEMAHTVLTFAEGCKTTAELEALWKQNTSTITMIKKLHKETQEQMVKKLNELHGRLKEGSNAS